jgi:hypothetical protein
MGDNKVVEHDITRASQDFYSILLQHISHGHARKVAGLFWIEPNGLDRVLGAWRFQDFLRKDARAPDSLRVEIDRAQRGTRR